MATDISELVQAAAGPPGVAQTRAAARLMSLLEDQPSRLAELFAKDAGGGSDAAQRELRPPEKFARDVGAKSRGGNVAEPSRLGGSEPRRDAAATCGARLILGITGAPGSGKSTLADALIAEFRKRYPEQRIGVVAVDPTSPFTGGAVLGDRVRMMRHATDPMVFIRSMATRGHLGGLTLGVRGAIRVLELIGCQLVILETVGVGQSEVEVAKVADLTVVVLAPGQGDSIQMLKAGLMEIADVFAVNKCDRPGSAELHAALLSMLNLAQTEQAHGAYHHLGDLPPALEDAPSPKPGPLPGVHLVSAVEHTGISELLDALEKRAKDQGGTWQERRHEAIREEIRQAVLEEVHRLAVQTFASKKTAHQVEDVLRGAVSVEELARELMEHTTRR